MFYLIISTRNDISITSDRLYDFWSMYDCSIACNVCFCEVVERSCNLDALSCSLQFSIVLSTQYDDGKERSALFISSLLCPVITWGYCLIACISFIRCISFWLGCFAFAFSLETGRFASPCTDSAFSFLTLHSS